MAKRVPEVVPKPWFIRPHHLKSVTDHPLSVNDMINLQDYSGLADRREKETVTTTDHITHLEWVINDLKSELDKAQVGNSEKHYTTTRDEIDKFHGWFSTDKRRRISKTTPRSTSSESPSSRISNQPSSIGSTRPRKMSE
jgi:hypothetical protein